MFRYLFNAVGFGWAVRISSLMTAVLCGVAILTVRPQHPIKKKAKFVLDVRITKDRRFLLLVSGSFFVCLGVPAFASVLPKSSLIPFRHVHTVLLHSRLRRVSAHPIYRCILCSLSHECWRRLWSRRTRLVIR